MIAVFCYSQAQYELYLQVDIKFYPKKDLKVIMDETDIRDINFAGVITLPGFYKDRKKENAYYALIIKQPELFE